MAFGGVYLGYNGDGTASFAGPGTIASSGSADLQNYGSVPRLTLTGGVTWDNAGFIQQDGLLQFGAALADNRHPRQPGRGTLDLTGNAAHILDAAGGSYSLVNAGLLEETGGNGTSNIDVTVVNTGTIAVTSGSQFAFNAGGTFSGLVDGAGGIALNGGDFVLTAGGVIDAAAVYDNAGTLTLQGGTITAPDLSAGLTVAAGAVITGYGVIGDLASSSGLIEAAGGLLSVNGTGGSGLFQIETGATLELTGASAQNVVFDGIDATLKLDDPTTYTGSLDLFGAGDTIDFAGVTLSAVAIANGELIGTLAAGGTIALAAPGVASGLKLSFASDHDGGNRREPGACQRHRGSRHHHQAGAGNSIVLPDVHVAASPDDQVALGIANTATAPADGLDVTVGQLTGAAYASGRSPRWRPAAATPPISWSGWTTPPPAPRPAASG